MPNIPAMEINPFPAGPFMHKQGPSPMLSNRNLSLDFSTSQRSLFVSTSAMSSEPVNANQKPSGTLSPAWSTSLNLHVSDLPPRPVSNLHTPPARSPLLTPITPSPSPKLVHDQLSLREESLLQRSRTQSQHSSSMPKLPFPTTPTTLESDSLLDARKAASETASSRTRRASLTGIFAGHFQTVFVFWHFSIQSILNYK